MSLNVSSAFPKIPLPHGNEAIRKADYITTETPFMQDLPQRYPSRVIRQVQESDTAYSLYIERQDMPVVAGKEIMLHGDAPHMDRQYSIASGETDEALRVLYKLIPDGALTPKLAALQPGDPIEFTGPFGSFVLRDIKRPITFIATGTGIAPAISFCRTHPNLNMSLLHGVRDPQDLYERVLLEQQSNYHPCISGDSDAGHFQGRVTNKLDELDLDPNAHYYLCGSNPMILEARKKLLDRNISEAHIFSEAYYFW